MTLDQLWAGWRNDYVVEAGRKERQGDEGSCVFCELPKSGSPSATNGIVATMVDAYCALNAYPYASGHMLILPFRHVGDLSELNESEAASIWALTRGAVRALEAAYGPDGVNIGANLGRAAGAGIPRHLHIHVLPRWSGDTNFMTSVAGVRVIPEPLEAAWRKLHAAFLS
jgi:ATP adenylyltransferase